MFLAKAHVSSTHRYQVFTERASGQTSNRGNAMWWAYKHSLPNTPCCQIEGALKSPFLLFFFPFILLLKLHAWNSFATYTLEWRHTNQRLVKRPDLFIIWFHQLSLTSALESLQCWSSLDCNPQFPSYIQGWRRRRSTLLQCKMPGVFISAQGCTAVHTLTHRAIFNWLTSAIHMAISDWFMRNEISFKFKAVRRSERVITNNLGHW